MRQERIAPKQGEFVQLSSDDWRVFDKGVWRSMTIEEQLEYSRASEEQIKAFELIVDSQGIRFGNGCWISHEKILKGAGPIVKNNYSTWFAALQNKGGKRTTLTPHSLDDQE